MSLHGSGFKIDTYSNQWLETNFDLYHQELDYELFRALAHSTGFFVIPVSNDIGTRRPSQQSGACQIGERHLLKGVFIKPNGLVRYCVLHHSMGLTPSPSVLILLPLAIYDTDRTTTELKTKSRMPDSPSTGNCLCFGGHQIAGQGTI